MATRELSRISAEKSRFGIPGVPVLLYHALVRSSQPSAESREVKYEVTAATFQNHVRRIRAGGRRVLSMKEILDASGVPSSESAVGITFDDGFVSDYEEAFPVLVKEGARGDFFVNTANIGKPGYLSWEQIREMHGGGMGIHSHGHSHAALSLLPLDGLRRELATSRKLLEDKLGSAVELIAVPYGLMNRRVIREAFAAGYRAVCNSWQWPAQLGSRSINRVALYGSTSLKEFGDLLDCRPGPYLRRLSRAVGIYFPRKLVLKFQPKLLGVIVQEESA